MDDESTGSRLLKKISERIQGLLPSRLRQSYVLKFASALLLIVALIAAVGIVFHDQTTAKLEANVEQQLIQETESEAVRLRRWIASNKLPARGISDHPKLREEKNTTAYLDSQLAEDKVPERVIAIHVVDITTEEVVASTETGHVGEKTSALAYGGLRGFMRLGTVDITRPFTNRNGTAVIAALSPVVQEPGQVLVLEISTADIADTFDSGINGTFTEVVQPTSQGTEVLFSNNPYEETKLTPYIPGRSQTEIPEISEAETNGTFRADPTKQFDSDHVVAYAQVEGEDWVVIKHAPAANAYQLREDIQQGFLIFLVLAVAGVVVVGGTFGRNTARAIQNLSQQARKIQHGNYDVELVSGRDDEIGRLFDSVRGMRDALADRIQASKLVEHSYGLITVIDPDGTITYQSPSVKHIVGLDPDAVTGTDLVEAVHPDDTSAVEAAIQRATDQPDTAQRFEYRIRDADGEWRVFQAVCENFLDDSFVDGCIISSRDVTDRKEYERELEATNTRLTLALEETDTGVWEFDVDTEAMVWDEGSAQLFGFEPGEFPGTYAAFADRVHDDDLEEIETAIDRAVETDESYRAEFRVELPDGGTRWIQARGVVEYDDGNPSRLFGIQTDVTERKQRERELQETKRELEQSNERLERFAYVATHDLQEPMRMVKSYVDLLEEELAEQLDGETKEFMQFAVEGADRMQEMLNGLLQYSRIKTRADPFVAVDAEAVVEEIRRDLHLRLEEQHAELTVESLPTVTADRDQLALVFQHLLTNALDHGGEGLAIDIRATERDEETEFAIADTGPGIPEYRQDDIFAIFDAGTDSEGTGIGLAVCQQIVHRHGGEIWVASTEGEGTTFHFTIATNGE